MLIAHLTDTHIKLPGKLAYGRVDTAAMLCRAVASLNALLPRPELVILTGDLVDFGDPREYDHLKSMLASLEIPFIVVAGNHDERHALREAFADHDYLPDAGFLQYVIEDRFPLRIIGLDTVVPREGRGELCSERLNWFSQALARELGRPTLVLMHHPPFESGIVHMDKVGLTGTQAFADILAQHPQIQAVLCGHLHRNIQTLVGGRRVLTSVSPAHQVALDLRQDAPSAFGMEPPGFMLHRWSGGQLVSHAAVIGDFDGPHPFFGPDGKLID